jgi:serine/threonine protein kinase
VGVSETTRIGTVLAGYRIESLLGRGGMSVVYLAEHMRLGRKVALKVLATPLAHDDSFRERFVRESQRAAELDHPNVIPIYDAGEIEGSDSDGLLYIAMRYVAGSDLRSLLKQEKRLSVGRTLFVLEQVAGALDAAHERKLIHRDVKPSNILVADPSEHVYLTDFGVAKQTTAPDLTRTGVFVGTVDYAAPEQIEGLTLGPHTDVYALGCVLYECLAGRPPFDREAEVAVMHAHLTGAPPRLSETRPDLPRELDRVIATAMAKSADDRFGRASELVDAAHAAVLQRRTTSVQALQERYEEASGAVPAEPPVEAAAPGAPATGAPGHVDSPFDTPSDPQPVFTEPPREPEPVSVESASSGAEVPAPATGAPPPAQPGVRSRPRVPRWAVTAALVAVAAIVSGTAAYLLARDDDKLATPASAAGGGVTTEQEAPASLAALVPRQLWKDCAVENQPAEGAVESAVCLQPADLGTQNPPDRWQISIYPDASALAAAYTAARERAGVAATGGRCDGTFWGGSGAWVHEGTPPKPGGSRFCYFDGDDAVMVWTHEKLAQPTHRDMLAIAREGSTDHAALFNWWRFWHHRIGKVGV